MGLKKFAAGVVKEGKRSYDRIKVLVGESQGKLANLYEMIRSEARIIKAHFFERGIYCTLSRCIWEIYFKY